MSPEPESAPIGPRLLRPLGAVLAAASALLLVCVALHPLLPLTPVGDLTVIAATGRWEAVHVGLLFATGGVIAGIWGPALAAPGAVRPLALAAAGLVALGQALNGANIAYMLGAGTEYARLYAAGDAGVAVTYHAGHLAAVMTGRLGGIVVSAGAALWAWLGWRGGVGPGGLAALAALAAVAGLAGAAFARPGHPLMLSAIGVMAVWQIWAGARVNRMS